MKNITKTGKQAFKDHYKNCGKRKYEAGYIDSFYTYKITGNECHLKNWAHCPRILGVWYESGGKHE